MWLVTRRDEMGNGVWVWREKDRVDQEQGKSSLCCWPWFCAEKNLSCLRDSFLPTDPIVRKYPFFSSIAEVLVLSDYTCPCSCGPWHLTFPPYEAQSGTPPPSPVMSALLSRDIHLEQTAPSHCSRRFITLPLVLWWFRPFSPSALDTSTASPVHPSWNCLW